MPPTVIAAPETRSRVLLVEDDECIGRTLSRGLRAHGYRTTWCRTGASARIEARERPARIVLVDLGLPDVDVLDFALDLRVHDPNVLIIMLTTLEQDLETVAALAVGVDDCLVTPLGLSVMVARLRAHLRRQERQSLARHSTSGSLRVVGSMVVDTDTRRCVVGSVEVTLRPKEFDLLAYLAAHPGVAVRREDVMSEVWGEPWFESAKTLDVTMSALRQRLDQASTAQTLPPGRTPTITTLRRHGYRLEAIPDPARGQDGDGK